MSHGDVWQLRMRGIRSFVQLPWFGASRVRAGDDVARRCFLHGRDSRVSVSDLTVPKSVVDRGCLRLLFARHIVNCKLSGSQPVSSLTYARHNASPHTDGHLLIRSSLHVKMVARAPSLHLSRKLRQSRHELPPAATKCSVTTHLHPNVIQRAVCRSD